MESKNILSSTTALVVNQNGGFGANAKPCIMDSSLWWFDWLDGSPVSQHKSVCWNPLLGSCVLVLSNHAKLCVFYWVLTCLKVVIEDQVEDAKFAQEKCIFSTFSAYTLIKAQYVLKTYCLLDRSSILPRDIKLRGLAKISNVKKPKTYLFET